MKIKNLISYIIFTIIIFGCSSRKKLPEKKIIYSLEDIIPYQECSDPVKLNDRFDGEFLLKDIDNLSYSTAYTSIYTPYSIVSDSLEKDFIRFDYAKKINKLVTLAFPKIEVTNDNTLLKKNYQYISKNTYNVNYRSQNFKSSVENLIIKSKRSDKQLFIKVYSSFSNKEPRIFVSIFVFGLYSPKLLYYDLMSYKCDIRDYTSLEKVISFALLKLKRNSV